MKYQNLFCSKTGLEKALDSKNVIKDILLKYSTVYINVSEDEFDNLLFEDPYFFEVAKLNPGHFFPEEKKDKETPFDIFLIDSSKDDCRNMSNQTGQLHINTDDLECNVLNEYHPWDFFKGEVYVNSLCEKIRCWQYVLQERTISPFNSIIINDKNLFDNPEGINQLKSFLSGILNNVLKAELHLTIFVLNSRKFGENNIVRYQGYIAEFLRKLGISSFKIQIVSHTENQRLHNREIILNYHSLESQYGLTKFNLTNGTAIDDNNLKLFGSYHSIELGPEKVNISALRKKIKKYYKVFNTSKSQSKINNTMRYVIGEGENRLFSIFK